MYSKDVFYEEVKDHVSKLNLDWFLQKQKEFEASKHYDKKEDSIIIVNKFYSKEDIFDKSGDIIDTVHHDISETIKIDLVKFCASYLPLDEGTEWGEFSVNNFDPRINCDPSNNIQEFSYELLNCIVEFIDNNSSTSEIYKFIAVFIETLEQELKLLKVGQPENVTYSQVLDNFKNICASLIYRKFEKRLTLYQLTDGHENKLKFTLNQNQLAALLYILQRAGFFSYTDNVSFIRFAFEHFMYTDEKSQIVSPSTHRMLQQKFSEIQTSQTNSSDKSNKAIDFVEKELLNVLKDIK